MKNLFKKTAKVLVLIGATAGVVSTSSAYFTDTATSTNNVVTTGEFDIEIRDVDFSEGWSDTIADSLNATDLMPVTDTNGDGNIMPEATALGEVHRGSWIRVRNPNSVPMAFDVEVTATAESGTTGNLKDWIHVRVARDNYSTEPNGDFLATGKLTNPFTFGDKTGGTPNYNLDPNEVVTLYFEFALENDTTAPQGENENVTFELTFTGQSI